MDGVCVVVVLAEAMMACVGRVANPSSDGKRRDHVAAVSSGECRIEAILMRGKFWLELGMGCVISWSNFGS